LSNNRASSARPHFDDPQWPRLQFSRWEPSGTWRPRGGPETARGHFERRGGIKKSRGLSCDDHHSAEQGHTL